MKKKKNCCLPAAPAPCVCLIFPFFIQAITARDSMAKSLYSALFDWIVLRINHALLNKKDMEESVPVRHKSHSTHTDIYKRFISSCQKLKTLLFFSACPSASWTFLASKTLPPTASSSSASTMQTSSCSITSTITSSTWNRWTFIIYRLFPAFSVDLFMERHQT